MENIFAVQDDIAVSVAESLRVTLAGGQTGKAREANPEAYNAYLQGRYFLDRRTKEDLEKASNYFEEVLRIDPNYARALVDLSKVHLSQANLGYLPLEQGKQNARNEVQKALELDPNLAAAHAQLGRIQISYDWDWYGADKSYKKALELEPTSAEVLLGAALLESTLGRFESAIRLTQRSIELDPLRVTGYSNLGLFCIAIQRYHEAEAAYRKGLELNIHFPGAHSGLTRVYLAQSNLEKAFAEIQMEPEDFWRSHGLALVYHDLGKKKEADDVAADFIKRFQNVGSFQVAEIYAYRDEKDKAFEWLERAYTQRDGGLTEIKGDPLLRNLETDPRYIAFLQKMKLPVD
jgi:tetratricopeptide (TPR) repeat protein